MGVRSKDRRVAFAVGSPAGPRASGWVAVASRKADDVYLSPLGALAGVKSFRFHQSGICRDAFIDTPPTLSDRAMKK